MNKKSKPRVPVHHSTRDRPLGSARPTGNNKMNVLTQYPKEGGGGVYNNPRLVHSCSSLIGAKVTVETASGAIFEGIFRTFSPQLELTIELVHLVDKDDPDKISEEGVRKTMVFPMQDIVRCSAIDTDLSYASIDGFRTDSQIANCNGETPMRELEQWIPDGVDNADFHELSLDNANGWRAEEMFEKNEREFHVKSTYSSTLEGYTVPLKVEDTKEYRELEARAELLAREIEGNQSNRSNIELEDGDEEETFSAVVRPDKGDDSSNDSDQVRKYVPPARRHQNNFNHSGRGDHRGGPRLGNPPFNNHHNPSTSPPNRESVNNKGPRNDRDYQKSPSMSPHGSSPSAYSSRDHHSYDSRHDDQARSLGGNTQNNGHRRSQHYGQGNGREHSRSGEQEASSHPNQRQHQQNRVGGFPSYPQLSRSHREQVSDLKDFHTKFLLATPSSVTLDLSGLKVKPQVHHTIQHLSEIRARSGSPQEHHQQQTSPKPVHQQGHPPQQQQTFQQQMPVRPETTTQFQQIPMRPETSSGTNLGLQRQQSNSETSIIQDPSPPASDEGSQARQPSPLQQSPVSVQNPSSPSQASSGGKKSTLNPNAKEFVLNPNAKVFVPVNASGSTAGLSSTPPQRPITPGTPMSYPSNAITPHQQFIQGAPAVQPHIYQYGAQQGTPYPFHPNGTIGALPPQSQQQHQRFRPNGNNQGQRQQGIPPMDIPPNSPMIVQGVPPMMTGSVPQAPQGPHPQNFIQQFQHQSHQFNAAASMMHANANMLMRLPPSAMNQMMVAQSPTTPPMPMTTISAIMDNAGGPHPMAVAWMQQHQGQAHITGVPPPQGNHMGPGHLGQPPPQPQMSSGGAPQQHTPAQVAAVQAAVAQAQQQAVASNGSHTPAPSPGPMSVYSPSGPQFSPGYPGMLMLPPGAPHPGMIQQTMMPGQGQGVPPPHHSQMQVHQFTMHQHPQMVPGQQNAPHLMLQQ